MLICVRYMVFFFFSFFFLTQKAAYEMRISDWSSDGCSSDLIRQFGGAGGDGLLQPVGALRLVVRVPARIAPLAIGGIGEPEREQHAEIGRASCRERVCQ